MNVCGSTFSEWMKAELRPGSRELFEGDELIGFNRTTNPSISSSLAPPCRLAALVLGVVVLVLAEVDVLRADADSFRSHEDPAIAVLIERLGARDTHSARKLRDKLRELGVTAFEALHAAQHHPDVEIRKQAEYLLRAIRIAWTQEDDPEEVKQLLERYQQEEFEERLECLSQLGRIEQGHAIPALCRLARFETSEVLSKYAALTVMRYGADEQTVEAAPMSAEIQRVIGNSHGAAANWLRVYAHSLLDPAATVADWQKVVAAELESVKQRPDKDRMAIVQELLRWQVEILQKMGRDEEMLAALQQLLPLLNNTRDELLQTVEWLLDRKAWSLVDDLVAAFPEPFQEDAFLLYRRAEAALRQGRNDEADRLAELAIAKKADDEPFLHVELGVDLQNRGLIDWAEREYRHTIATSEQGTHPPVEAAIRLGWMFHDLARITRPTKPSSSWSS